MANHISFRVQGSEPEPYEVSINFDGEQLRATCTCRAGISGKYACKHRLRLLTEDPHKQEDAETAEGMRIAQSWLTGTEVERCIKEIESAQREVDLAKKKLNQHKQELAKAMRG